MKFLATLSIVFAATALALPNAIPKAPAVRVVQAETTVKDRAAPAVVRAEALKDRDEEQMYGAYNSYGSYSAYPQAPACPDWCLACPAGDFECETDSDCDACT